jgi:endonuclease YncB( thermonuclease family)
VKSRRNRRATGTLALIAVVVSRSSAGSTASAIVASVYDGDTLTLTNGQRVRLLQIDTPELGSGECYSRAARTELRRRLRAAVPARPRLRRVLAARLTAFDIADDGTLSILIPAVVAVAL